MIQFQNRLLNSLVSIFFLSLSIFFRKKSLMIFTNRLNLILWFMIIINIILFLNLVFFQKESFRKIRAISFPELRLIFLAGTLLLSFYTLATFGLDLVTSINYSFISRITLIFSAILAYFFLNEEMNGGKISLIFLFMIGIYIISTEGKRIVLQFGDLLILIGTFCFSSFAIIQKKLCKNLIPGIISWAVTLSGVLVIILVSLVIRVGLLPENPYGFLYILFAGGAEALAVLFMNRTVYISNVTYYTMMSMLTPVLNAFLGVIFLSESLSIIQIVGGAILIISGVMVQRLKC
ncbi:MAG: DMT family transporter [Atribacterota bacterium]